MKKKELKEAINIITRRTFGLWENYFNHELYDSNNEPATQAEILNVISNEIGFLVNSICMKKKTKKKHAPNKDLKLAAKKYNEGEFTNSNIDLAYFTGVFNVSGIDGLGKEIDRLKGLNKLPHELLHGYGS